MKVSVGRVLIIITLLGLITAEHKSFAFVSIKKGDIDQNLLLIPNLLSTANKHAKKYITYRQHYEKIQNQKENLIRGIARSNESVPFEVKINNPNFSLEIKESPTKHGLKIAPKPENFAGNFQSCFAYFLANCNTIYESREFHLLKKMEKDIKEMGRINQ